LTTFKAGDEVTMKYGFGGNGGSKWTVLAVFDPLIDGRDVIVRMALPGGEPVITHSSMYVKKAEPLFAKDAKLLRISDGIRVKVIDVALFGLIGWQWPSLHGATFLRRPWILQWSNAAHREELESGYTVRTDP
jgi:hypothetical protein